jgi:gliding motility-associated-like protein
MYTQFKKINFILFLLFSAVAATAQNNITQWGGTITVNPSFDIGSPQDLINGNLSDDPYFFSFSSPTIIVFHAVSAVVLSSYRITDYYYTYGSPSAWTFSGSNDGVSWTVLDAQNGTGFSQATQSYTLTGNTTAYSYYQWSITSVVSSFGSELDLSELELFTLSPPPPPALTGNAFSGTEAGLSWKVTGAYDSAYLQRSADNTSYATIKQFSNSVSAYTDQTLSPAALFYYRLRVKLPDGSFQYSDTAQVTTNNLSGQSSDITNDGGNLYVSADNVNGAASTEGSVHLIDHKRTTKWLVFTNEAPGDLSAVYKPTGSYIVTGYILTTAGDSPPRDPKNWIFSGSNDSTTWVTLDNQANQLGNNAARWTDFSYVVLNPGTIPYKFYRILFTDNNGAFDGVRFQIGEWEILGIDATAPAIPAKLVPTSSTINSLSLSWSEAATNPVTGFLLQRSNNGTDFTTIDSLGAGITSFTDKNLYDSTTYYYRLQALGSRPTAISGWSNVAQGTTAFVAGQPLTPTQLVTTFAIDSVVGLQWVDRSYNETGFRLERSTDGVSFSVIDSLPANTTVFNDSADLWPATKYYYRIAAFNAQSMSGYSNMDSATTTGANSPPVLTQVLVGQDICSNTAEYTFNINGLVPGPHNELTQSLSVTSVGADSANARFFSNFSFVPAVNNGVATFMVKGSGAGTYGDTAIVIVTIKDNGGTTFFGTDSLQVPFTLIYKPLTVSITADRDTVNIPKYAIVGLMAGTNYPSTTPGYTWDEAPGIEGSRNNLILNVSPVATTKYKVTATSTAGCTATAQITLSPEAGRSISNVLTPNGDGKNDTWIIWGITQNQHNSVKVFDRAGRLVFYKQNYSNDWNGTYNGKALDEGAYFYVVDYGDGQKPVTGMLTIIRDHK